MSNVNLTIGGRNFTVACAEGEESHVSALGRMIDTKLSAMGDMAGQSEVRTLLFAALLLADELHEAKSSHGGAPASPAPESPLSESPLVAEKLEEIAERMENLASRLEG